VAGHANELATELVDGALQLAGAVLDGREFGLELGELGFEFGAAHAPMYSRCHIVTTLILLKNPPCVSQRCFPARSYACGTTKTSLRVLEDERRVEVIGS
jgi:hypothetical protein